MLALKHEVLIYYAVFSAQKIDEIGTMCSCSNVHATVLILVEYKLLIYIILFLKVGSDSTEARSSCYVVFQ